MKAAAIITAGIAIVVIGAAIGLALGGTSGDTDTESFEVDGFAIDVPSDWQELNDVPFPVARTRSFDLSGAARGIDVENWIVAYSTPRPGSTPISSDNVLALAPSLKEGFEKLAKSVPGGRLVNPPSAVEANGLPGLQLTFSYEGPEGAVNTYQLFQLVDDARVYSVGCNATSNHAEDVNSACREAIGSLRVLG